MLVEIVKRADGAGVLRCTRADGSITWQKQVPRHAAHFAPHDLTHFAVETTLGFRQGFFGLLASGWEVEDTTGKGARGPLPPEAGVVEHIVGLLDSERACGCLWTVEEFHTYTPPGARLLTAEEILAVRKRRGELFRQWSEVAPGESLQLEYPEEVIA